MNAKDIGTMAMIAGIGAAAMVDDPRRHPDKLSALGSKRYRKQRNKKNRTAKASRKKNRG